MSFVAGQTCNKRTHATNVGAPVFPGRAYRRQRRGGLLRTWLDCTRRATWVRFIKRTQRASSRHLAGQVPPRSDPGTRGSTPNVSHRTVRFGLMRAAHVISRSTPRAPTLGVPKRCNSSKAPSCSGATRWQARKFQSSHQSAWAERARRCVFGGSAARPVPSRCRVAPRSRRTAANVVHHQRPWPGCLESLDTIGARRHAQSPSCTMRWSPTRPRRRAPTCVRHR